MPKKSKSEEVLPKAPVELRPRTSIIQESDATATIDLMALRAALELEPFFVFDTETDGRHFMLAVMDGVGFYLPNSDSGYYVNFYKSTERWRNQVVAALKPVFENEKIGKIGHNILFDMHIMKNVGVDVFGPILDTMIASYIVNPDDRPFSLKKLAPRHCGVEMRVYDDIDRENIRDMAIYCMEDSRCTFLLYKNRKDALIKEKLWSHFTSIEMAFLRVLFDMERTGIKVDTERLTHLRKVFERIHESYKKKFCKEMFGVYSDKVLISVPHKVKGVTRRDDVPFNIDSTDHLGELIYTMKKYPVLSWTKGGKKGIKKPSTDKEALIRLADEGHKGMDLLMKYREMQKLLTSFVIPILDEHRINGRVHSSYFQHGTRTGRLSSGDPNFQNIPVKSIYGKALRSCFVADPGFKLVDADLSQIELRIMAHFSKDPNLVKVYRENGDLHDVTCQLVLHMAPGESKEKKNKARRTLGKGLNFGLQYGAGSRKFTIVANRDLPGPSLKCLSCPAGTCKGHKLTEPEAKEYIITYFKKYSGVRAFQIAYPREIKRNGYAMTVLGRKRYLPDINSSRSTKEGWRKAAAAERAGLSTLIQGSASDVLKLAMIKAHARGLKLVGQIHDELLMLVPQDRAKEQANELKDCMEHCGLTFDVPIVADIQIVDKWEGPAEDNISLLKAGDEEKE